MKQKSLFICHAVLAAALLALTASCLDGKDPYNAGFFFHKPTGAVNTIYANNVLDSIVVFSYGKWSIFADGHGDWYTIDRREGNAESTYSIPVRFTQNATGVSRSVKITFTDTSHPDDAHAALLYWQYATRGDGTMGMAADVKCITGSDGSRFDFTYDSQHRPTSLTVKQNGDVLHNIQLRFNDYDSTLTVSNKSHTMTARYDKDYQPMLLVGETDTVGYYSQYYYGYIEAPTIYAFNIEHHSYGRDTKRYALKLGGQSLLPDSLHNADSLRIATSNAYSATTLKYKLAYSAHDNRYQSVDVNQLVFGTEQCDPYQLLSLFRYARNTSIVDRLTDEKGDAIVVEVKLNANKSVSEMTIRHSSGGTVSPDSYLTYVFEY